jgi:hypothetical protein
MVAARPRNGESRLDNSLGLSWGLGGKKLRGLAHPAAYPQPISSPNTRLTRKEITNEPPRRTPQQLRTQIRKNSIQ